MRKRIHSYQLPRLNKINRSNTFDQHDTIKRNNSCFLLQLTKRSQLLISYFKDPKYDQLIQFFNIPDDIDLNEIQANIHLEYIAIILCYLIKHDLTVSLLYGYKSKFIKTTLMHHQMWMKYIKLREEPLQKLLKVQSSLDSITSIIIQYHIDDSHLRIHLLEYFRLKLYQSNFVMYSKIIINKIIPLLQTPNIVGNHIPINFESYTLVLDMDETLIYYDSEKVYQRPFLLTFLKQMSRIYELILFTAGLESYAHRILNKLTMKQYFTYFLFRQHTNIYKEFYGKDLRKLGRLLSKTIIIDNTPECFSLQPENGIQIQTWKGDLSDTVLLTLIPILKAIRFSNKDIRMKLREYKNYPGLIFPK
ncbi:unnamed protein product [Paramecium pentaurelia]|uniref:Mitochondrial import inner membrane translocase subunit TIM50 n=1 Tax=Paramecium pentaurelia TaxID=43138 RepID=A0A8S1SGA2_9CILI|nr:unnamed protein product [Paramecium pentaurelia]